MNVLMQAGEVDPDLFFTDQPRDARLGRRNREVISIFADHAPRALQVVPFFGGRVSSKAPSWEPSGQGCYRMHS